MEIQWKMKQQVMIKNIDDFGELSENKRNCQPLLRQAFSLTSRAILPSSKDRWGSLPSRQAGYQHGHMGAVQIVIRSQLPPEVPFLEPEPNEEV